MNNKIKKDKIQNSDSDFGRLKFCKDLAFFFKF